MTVATSKTFAIFVIAALVLMFLALMMLLANSSPS
jgi:hypothetical protein